MPSDFRYITERALAQGRFVRLTVGTFVDPDGAEFEREIVRHPGAVSVVPVLDDGATALCVRQYRAPVDRVLLEIPAGKLDVEGEDPAAAAARELEEEVGMRAGRLERLCEFYNSPGFCDEHATLYVATQLEACELSAQGIEERHMTLEHVALSDVDRLVADGTLVDAKSIIGLLLTRDRLSAR